MKSYVITYTEFPNYNTKYRVVEAYNESGARHVFHGQFDPLFFHIKNVVESIQREYIKNLLE